MGEGIGNDELLMPFISDANIACGYHAGDAATIWKTTELAIKNKLGIGAHVSFLDKENFGRKEINCSPEEIYELVTQQLVILHEITNALDGKLQHVKPHGALYNMSAKDIGIAKTIAQAIKDFDPALILYGLSGSNSIKEAKAIGLKTVSEVFADRTYQDDGSLTSRLQTGALLEDVSQVVQQVLQMIKEGTVTAVNGKNFPIVADTICIHGDGIHALEFSKAISESLLKNNIQISSAPGT